MQLRAIRINGMTMWLNGHNTLEIQNDDSVVSINYGDTHLTIANPLEGNLLIQSVTF